MRTHHTTTTRRITTVRNPFHRDLSYSLGTGVGGDRPAATETETWRSKNTRYAGSKTLAVDSLDHVLRRLKERRGWELLYVEL